MESVLRRWLSPPRSPRVVVLGVTPEMARLPWPKGTELLAVDYSQPMIDMLWPGFPSPGEGVVCANWLDLPLGQERARDLVIGDGPFSVLRYPVEYRQLLRALGQVLEPNGLFAFRVMVRPELPENPTAVYEAAMAGEMGSFHVFKLRLFMAMQSYPEAGMRTGDAWISWSTDGPGADKLVARSGWPAEQVASFESYQDKDTVYTFPTLDELRSLLDEEGFREVECLWPTYELGERCPTLIFRRDGAAG